MCEDTRPVEFEAPKELAALLKENRSAAADPQTLGPGEMVARYYVEAWIREELEEHPEDREWISLLARAILAHPTDPAAGRFRFIPEMLAEANARAGHDIARQAIATSSV